MKDEPDFFDVIIIGAGPAGLFCAINCCAEKPCRVLILEKKNAAGRKLLLSGSGSCNITHSGSIKNFEQRYGLNGKFLRHAFSGFSNINMIGFLESNGIKTTEMDNGKIFPESMKASDILEMLLGICSKSGIQITYSSAVSEITYTDSGRFIIRAGNFIYINPVYVL